MTGGSLAGPEIKIIICELAFEKEIKMFQIIITKI